VSRAATLATTVAIAILALPSLAHAAGARVVVAGPEGDSIASGLQKELTAMGFDPVRVDEADGCAPGAVRAWIEEANATAAACSTGGIATVWIKSRTGLHVAEVVSPREGDTNSDVVAVRAAESTRANLELSAAEPEPAPSPPPTSSTTTPPDADVAPAAKRPTAPEPPRMPAFVIGTGISALMGADASAPALDSEAQLRVARYLGLSARSALTFDGATVTTSRSVVHVAPSTFGVGPVIPLASSDSFLVPRIGGGGGVVWLRSSAALIGSGASAFGPSDIIVSPMAYADAAVSMRIGGPLRLTLEGLVATTAHRMVVRAASEEVAYWGQPFGSVALRAEVMFR
jgi:hypothetical protein